MTATPHPPARERRAPMPDTVKLAIAAAIVVVLALWGIHGPGFAGGTAKSAEAKLQLRADRQVAAIGAGGWARVTLHGQRADIEGLAPSEEDLAIVRGAVRDAVWDGGWLMGGVTRVSSRQVQVWPGREGPYLWRAALDGEVLRLSGVAPSSEIRRDLETLAAALFADRRLESALELDPIPPGDGWAEAARGGLAVLSHLQSGAATLADFELEVTGVAATPADADAARASLERLTGVVSAVSRADVRASPPPRAAVVEPPSEPAPELLAVAPAEPGAAAPEETVAEPPAEPAAVEAHPVVEAEAVAAEDSGVACQAQLDVLLADSQIHFDVDSAELSAASLPLLDQIAAVAVACPPLVLRVEGHTDGTGVAALNQTLSERRASAVADRLAQLGVEPARLRAVGLGASRPAADDSTEDGRRENRRIEIIVEPVGEGTPESAQNSPAGP